MVRPLRSNWMVATKLATICVCAATAICAVRGAEAQGTEKRDNNLDLTMTLLPEHAKGPEDITRRIELPPPRPPAEPKDAHGPNGDQDGDSKKDDKGPPAQQGDQSHSNADQAREQGRDFG